MTSVTQVIKSGGPKLVPFFKTVAIYFVVFIPQDSPSIFAMALKCLPAISLIIFILLHGTGFGKEHRYSRRIIWGLAFSCIGDACLIWPQYFELGMVAFAIGHASYISAFGFKPLNLPLGIAIYAITTLGIAYIMPGLTGVLVVAVPIYSYVLTTMLWRALARLQLSEDLWTWSKLCACAGALLFVVSDFIIGISHFKFPVENNQVLIMATYYAGQLGITLSVVDAMAPEKKVAKKVN